MDGTDNLDYHYVPSMDPMLSGVDSPLSDEYPFDFGPNLFEFKDQQADQNRILTNQYNEGNQFGQGNDYNETVQEAPQWDGQVGPNYEAESTPCDFGPNLSEFKDQQTDQYGILTNQNNEGNQFGQGNDYNETVQEAPQWDGQVGPNYEAESTPCDFGPNLSEFKDQQTDQYGILTNQNNEESRNDLIFYNVPQGAPHWNGQVEPTYQDLAASAPPVIQYDVQQWDPYPHPQYMIQPAGHDSMQSDQNLQRSGGYETIDAQGNAYGQMITYQDTLPTSQNTGLCDNYNNCRQVPQQQTISRPAPVCAPPAQLAPHCDPNLTEPCDEAAVVPNLSTTENQVPRNENTANAVKTGRGKVSRGHIQKAIQPRTRRQRKSSSAEYYAVSSLSSSTSPTNSLEKPPRDYNKDLSDHFAFKTESFVDKFTYIDANKQEVVFYDSSVMLTEFSPFKEAITKDKAYDYVTKETREKYDNLKRLPNGPVKKRRAKIDSFKKNGERAVWLLNKFKEELLRSNAQLRMQAGLAPH